MEREALAQYLLEEIEDFQAKSIKVLGENVGSLKDVASSIAHDEANTITILDALLRISANTIDFGQDTTSHFMSVLRNLDSDGR